MSHCHKVGHLYKECPLVQKPPKATMEKEGGIGRASVDTPKKAPLAAPSPSGKTTSVQQAQPSLGCSSRPPSPPLTRARTATEAMRTSGISLPPLPVLSSTYAYFAHHLHNASVLDQTTFPPPIPCPQYSHQSVYSTTSPSLPPKASTNPSLTSSAPPHSYNLSPCSLSTDSPSKLSGLGLSFSSIPIKPLCGRKSYLSHAILRAGAEVASGRQSSLDQVLRAANTHDMLPP